MKDYKVLFIFSDDIDTIFITLFRAKIFLPS